jgi:phage terminase Nu1 subunit (DNA packaging protein)
MTNLQTDLLATYLDRDQLAEMFSCSGRTISRYMSQPDGLPHLYVGGRTLFRLEAVRDWLERRERRPNPRRRA